MNHFQWHDFKLPTRRDKLLNLFPGFSQQLLLLKLFLLTSFCWSHTKGIERQLNDLFLFPLVLSSIQASLSAQLLESQQTSTCLITSENHRNQLYGYQHRLISRLTLAIGLDEIEQISECFEKRAEEEEKKKHKEVHRIKSFEAEREREEMRLLDCAINWNDMRAGETRMMNNFSILHIYSTCLGHRRSPRSHHRALLL